MEFVEFCSIFSLFLLRRRRRERWRGEGDAISETSTICLLAPSIAGGGSEEEELSSPMLISIGVIRQYGVTSGERPALDSPEKEEAEAVWGLQAAPSW